MESSPARAALYLRESVYDPDGIARHRADCLRVAAERGWQVTAEYTDNGMSAYDKRKVRPDYERMRGGYRAGEFDALICWDLDRLYRQPRQLEDWIDDAEERGLRLVTANGEADLSTDNGRLFARIKASVARAEVERKSARQTLAAAQRADNGRPPAGVRLTGYTVSGDLVESEAAVVRGVFERFHAGDSLKGIAGWLAETGVPTRRGGAWNPSSVRGILTNPRYAGRAVYRGQANGKTGTWQAIVPEWLFDAVSVRLSDPRRRTNKTGTDRKYLGGSLYLCGVCGGPVRSHAAGGLPAYRCPQGGHVLRATAPVDRFVLAVVRARLGKPDLAGLLSVPTGGQAKAAADKVAALRSRIARTEADYDADLIDGQRYKVKTAKLAAGLKAAEAAQARLMAGTGVAGVMAAPDPVAAFGAAPLGVQREVIGFLMTVRLHHAPRGRHFDPGTVEIRWRHE